jgi:hypothetical protein
LNLRTTGSRLIFELDPHSTETSTETALARSTCTIAIPVSVPAGKRLVLRRLIVTGTADVASGTKSEVAAEVFTAGSRGPRVRKSLTTGAGPWVATPGKSGTIRTTCGANTNLRINASATLIAGPNAFSASRIEIQKISLELIEEACL